jgi:hypothetical protein
MPVGNGGSQVRQRRSKAHAPVVLLAVVVLVAAGCSSKTKHLSQRAAAIHTTTTTRPPVPVAPLTGGPDPFGVAAHRCAITVKIDNTPEAQPHYGLEQADVVYEEVVEGGITRLAAIFNSLSPDRVGPVRSVRKTDQSIVWPIRGIFAYSGGAPYAIASIDTAPVVQLNETAAGSMMFRDYSRQPPHNLYAHVDQMYARCKDGAPQPLFKYRPSGAPVGGVPVTAVQVGFQGKYAVTWQWNPANGTWRRILFGQPEVSGVGVAIAPRNVVVMVTSYVGGDPLHSNEGAEATLTGFGPAWVYTAGREIHGSWVRPDKAQPARLLNAAGQEIRLTPGQTWVELPDRTYTITSTRVAPAQ